MHSLASDCIPISLGKLGGIEASHIYHYLTSGPALVRGNSLHTNAGIYCENKLSLIEWCNQYIDAVKDLDFILQWCPEQGDKYVIKAIKAKGSTLTDFDEIEPFTHGKNGWHYTLSDKRVLVVSPFVDTILQQSLKYGDIWPGATIGSVVVLSTGYSEALTGLKAIDWKFKMDKLKEEISKAEFDFAVVGCGGYSLEVCRFVKAMGKSVVHLGGGTQLLFGIRGKRWDACFRAEKWYGTSQWIRPLLHEVPVGYKSVENGCYW